MSSKAEPSNPSGAGSQRRAGGDARGGGAASTRHEWTGRGLAVLLLRVGVAGALLSWLFREFGGPAPVLAVMRTARPELVVAALVVTLFTHAIASHRLVLLTRALGAGLRTREMLEINLATLFYGMVLPGGGITAIAIRFHRLTQADRKYSAALVALVCDKLLATAALSVVGLSFWLVAAPPRSSGALILMAATAGALALTLLTVFTAAPARAMAWVLYRIPPLRAAVARLTGTLDIYRALPAAERLWLVALSIVSQLLGIGAYLLIALALSFGLPFAAMGWIRTTVILAAAIPITVSGFGVREGMLVRLLDAHGVPGHTALAYSLLVFGVTGLGVGLVGGLVEVARWLRRRGDPGGPPVRPQRSENRT